MQANVQALIQKARDAISADDAMKFAQAALNCANAMRALNDIDISKR